MCFEDVQMGRETAAGQFLVPIGNTAKIVVGESERRYCLILPNLLTGNVTYSMDPSVTSGVGIVLNANSGPLVLTVQEHGDICRRAWYAITDQASTSLLIIASHLGR